MIDLHTHILPRMDDGSRSVDESISLLKMLDAQGVDTAVATPHFYANDESVGAFLERRAAAFDSLQVSLFEEAPRILLGAEVKYYSGISRMSELKSLCIEGSRLLLLEMSMSKWTEYTVKEITELSGSGDITVVLAHIERYMRFQDVDALERLYDSGVLMQANASFFTGLGTRRQAISLLKDRFIHFLGSDCHNTTSRPPSIGKAVEIIQKKMGNGFIDQMVDYGNSMLGYPFE